MPELHTDVRVACFSIGWNDVLTLKYLDAQLVVFLLYGRGNHYIFLFWYSRNRLCFQFQGGIRLTKHRNTDLNVADNFTEGPFDIGKDKPTMVDTMIRTVIDGADGKFIAADECFEYFFLSIMDWNKKFLSLGYACILPIKYFKSTSNLVWK